MKKTVNIQIEIDTDVEQTESSYTVRNSDSDGNMFTIKVFAEKHVGIPVHHTLAHELGHVIALVTDQPAHVRYGNTFLNPIMSIMFPREEKAASIKQEEEAWENAERMLFHEGKRKAMSSYETRQVAPTFAELVKGAR